MIFSVFTKIEKFRNFINICIFHNLSKETFKYLTWYNYNIIYNTHIMSVLGEFNTDNSILPSTYILIL